MVIAYFSSHQQAHLEPRKKKYFGKRSNRKLKFIQEKF